VAVYTTCSLAAQCRRGPRFRPGAYRRFYVSYKHQVDQNPDSVQGHAVDGLPQSLSTLPDYVLYRHAGLVFPGKCTRRHRHKY